MTNISSSSLFLYELDFKDLSSLEKILLYVLKIFSFWYSPYTFYFDAWLVWSVICNIDRSLITEVWNVLQESTIRYVSNTMFLPLIVRWLQIFQHYFMSSSNTLSTLEVSKHLLKHIFSLMRWWISCIFCTFFWQFCDGKFNCYRQHFSSINNESGTCHVVMNMTHGLCRKN